MFSIHRSTFVAVTGLSVVIGLSLAVAQGQPPSAGPAKLTDFVSPDFCMAMVIHPRQMLRSPAAQALGLGRTVGISTTSGVGAESNLLERITPDKVRRVVVLLDPTATGSLPVSQAAIFQFEEDIDSPKILAEILPDLKTVPFQGKTYVKSVRAGQGGVPVAAYVPGSRMLLVASEPTLKKMLAANAGPRPLLDQLRRADFKNDVVIEVVAAPLAKLARSLPTPPGAQGAQMPMVISLLEEVKTASITLSFSGPQLLHATIYGAKKDSVEKLHSMASMFQMMGSQQTQPPKGVAAPNDTGLASVFGEILKGMEVTRKTDCVVISIPMLKNLPELAKKLSDMAQSAAVMNNSGSEQKPLPSPKPKKS